jgi:hypothetical protein
MYIVKKLIFKTGKDRGNLVSRQVSNKIECETESISIVDTISNAVFTAL